MAQAKAVKTFNMTDLSSDVAGEFGLTKASGGDITRFVFDRIKQALVEGNQVRLHRYGTLVVNKRKAGVARNPKTGDKIKVSARRVVKFKPSPALKQML